MTSSLQRIILINTHLNGVSELKLDGHTNICGTNASGKTTLQRLIPVFYGEYPSRVVPATRDSFEQWYLPFQNSYIIYEYLRHDACLCQVVLTSSGAGVDFRFVPKAFDLEDYSREELGGERQAMLPKDHSRLMAQAGYKPSRLLNTKEYRAVIQNDRSVLNRQRDLPALASRYSLCEPGCNLRHIEKLAKAVHSREGKMETIKAMVAAILEEDGIVPGEHSLSRNKVEEWIGECALIKKFEGIRPQFTRLEQEYEQLQHSESRLAQLFLTLKTDLSQLAAQLSRNEILFEDNKHLIKQLDHDWEQRRDELKDVLSECKADIDKFETDLQFVEDQFDQWQAKDIEQLKQDVEQLPIWQNELSNAQSRYELLTNQHQDVEASYHKQLNDIHDNFDGQFSLLNDQKTALQDEKLDREKQANERLLQLKQKFQQALNTCDNEFSGQSHDLQIRQTELYTLHNNAGYSDEEKKQLDILDHAISEASQREDSSRQVVAQHEATLNQALKKRQEVDQQLAKARHHTTLALAAQDEVHKLLYPGEHTLLEFLRAQKPGWESALGKVIRPELLQRHDLKPAHDGAGENSLFGVNFDLTSIELPDYAKSEHELNELMLEKQATHEEAMTVQSEIEDQLQQHNKQVRDAEIAVNKAKTECSNREQSRKRAQQDKSTTQAEFNALVTQRKLDYSKKLQEIANELAQLANQKQDALEEIRDQQHDAEMDHQSHWQLILSELAQQIDQANAHLSQCKTQEKAEKAKAQQWLENELAKRGVDVDEIGQLKKRMQSLSGQIKQTQLNKHLVADYEHWFKTVYQGHKVKWLEQLNASRQKQSTASLAFDKEKASYQHQRSKTQETITQLEQLLAQIKQEMAQLQQLEKQLNKLKLPMAEVVVETGTVGQRIHEIAQLLQQHEQLTVDIKTLVESFDQQIASQSGSGLADIWEFSRKECTRPSALGVATIDHIALVAHLDKLLNVHVPQRMNALREQGRIFGKGLSEYYILLKDIEAHIGNQSKRISSEVQEELFLDGVSESAVKIRSRISGLEFWDDLKRFNQHYIDWINSGGHQLPNDEYASAMRKVIEILGRTALTGGINKLLDIELHLREGESDLVIRTDRQLNESSSHGMAYLILCKFLLAFTRLLRGKSQAVIHWPIDELGTLHQSNIKKIFDACQNNRIHVVGAFPNPESDVLTLFNNRYLIDKHKKQLQVVQPKISAIHQKLQQKVEQSEESTC